MCLPFMNTMITDENTYLSQEKFDELTKELEYLKTIRRRYCNGEWWPTIPEIALFNPDTMRTTRYRYRGTAIPTPWPTTG